MKALPFLLVVIGFVVLAMMVHRTSHENRIRTHKIDLGMPATEVRRSMGDPMGVITRAKNQQTWIYPDVAVTFGYGGVIDTEPLTKEAAAYIARADPNFNLRNPTPAPVPERHTLLDQPAYR